MNIVDSSGWLEYFAEGPNADFFAPAVEKVNELITPSISLYEVFKRVMQQRSGEEALKAVAIMAQGRVIDLDMSLALAAAKTSAEEKLPMADSIILATARAFEAIVWTQDADLADIERVQYIKKQPTPKS